MARLREFFRKNPAAGYALGFGLVIIAGYLIFGQVLGGPQEPTPAEQPPPRPSAAPPQAPAASPPAAAPLPSASALSPRVVPPGPTGRTDPFVPLVTPPAAAPTPPPQPAGPPLPPPPFPGPGALPPPPPAPGAPGAEAPPPSPPEPSAGVSLTGIVGDAKKVVIVSVGGTTEILFEGESVGDLRVIKIDPARGIVTFERAGQRFDVSLGGG